MTHGEFPNVYCSNEYPPDIRNADNSHFFLQNVATGDLTHIVSLGCHYEVKDVCFVTLRKDDGVETPVTYCCFCGTHTADSAIEYGHAIGDEPVPITYIYAKRGFTGFFSMDDALSPTSTCTAKVRYVNGTRDLYRMVAYPQEYGRYYSYQSTYIDNMVLDIVGVPMTNASPSSLSRVRIYPDCPISPLSPSGTIWDIDIRYNSNSPEMMTDIVTTEEHLITASHPAGDSTVIWLRHSPKEVVYYPSDLNLDPQIHIVDLSSLVVDGRPIGDQYGTLLWKRYRLCNGKSGEYALSFFYMPKGESVDYGLVLNRYGTTPNFAFYQSRYLEVSYMPGDMVYISNALDHALVLDEYGGNGNMTAIMSADLLSPNFNTSLLFYGSPMKFTSIGLQYNSMGSEVLHWGGLNMAGNDDSWLAYEILYRSRARQTNCIDVEYKYTFEAEIEHLDDDHEFPVQRRYELEYDYEVKKLQFNPYNVYLETKCTESYAY
ncbi:MAG: hypothetical protein K5864_04685 [Bacteroidales bacterium]|nr:hypothetical protein [Bacteroidales bacterium]